MDKIISVVLVAIVLSFCGEKNSSQNEFPKIVFIYQNDIVVDFDKKELRLEYNRSKYMSKILLSIKEDSLIKNSFKKNKIYEIKEDIEFQDCRASLIPRFENRIEIYNKNKLKATVTIKSNHNVPPRNPPTSSREYRMLCFHDDLKKIIESNEAFVKALNRLRLYNKDSTAITE